MDNTRITTPINWKKYALLLVAVYLLVYILPLGLRAPMIPDELRYAEIPHEMITSGDWIAPHLNGLRYFEKPVLGYWVTGISMQLFGENAFAMRLPSALSAGLSALAVFLLLARFGRRYDIALYAAMIYLSMLGVYLIGAMNILDSLFSFLLTAAFVSFYFSHSEREPGKRLVYLLLLGVFCGAAFLTKGFLAFVLLAAVIGPFVIWQGRWQELFSRGWIALVMALVVIAPWAVMVHLQEPDYWRYFFWEEHIKRFASEDAQHGEPFWFYLMYLPLLTLPWITQLPVAAGNIFGQLTRQSIFAAAEQGSDAELLRFVSLWLLMPFLFFSIANGKLPTYILPCLPPLAVLLAIGIQNYLDAGNILPAKSARQKLTGYKLANASLAVFFFIVCIALIVIQTGIGGKPVWTEEEAWKWVSLATAFFIGGTFLLLTLKCQSVNRRFMLQAASVIAIVMVINIGLPQRTMASKMPGDFLLAHKDLVTADTILMSDDIMIHAVNWYFRRTDVYMTGAGESKHGLSFSDSRHRLIEGDALKNFINSHLGKQAMVIVHHSDADEKMQAIMPPQAEEFRWGRFVLWYIAANNPVADGKSAMIVPRCHINSPRTG